VHQWLRVRDEYLEAKTPDTILVKDGINGRKLIQIEKSLDDPQLFPFTHTKAYHMWNNALRKAGTAAPDTTRSNQSPSCVPEAWTIVSHITLLSF